MVFGALNTFRPILLVVAIFYGILYAIITFKHVYYTYSNRNSLQFRVPFAQMAQLVVFVLRAEAVESLPLALFSSMCFANSRILPTYTLLFVSFR